MFVPDNYDQYRAHEARQQSETERLPVCYECGQPIQSDECYEINDEVICPQCLAENHRKWVDDLVC